MVKFPPVPDGDPIRISASTFVAYRRCPELADARIHGEYGPGSVVAFKGGLAHRVFARHLRTGPIPGSDFSRVCREEIGSSNLNHQMAELRLRGRELKQVVNEVRALYGRFVKFPTDGFAGAEVELEAEPAAGVQLLGLIDAVFETSDRVRLVDWKTGGLGDSEVQLGFYGLLWTIVHAAPPSIVEAVSVGTGERSTTSPTADDVGRTAREVAAMVADLRSAWRDRRLLPRRGGPWCPGCARLPGCPEGQAAVSVAGARR